MLKKNSRIHQKEQYRQVFQKGRKLVGRSMVMLFMENGLETARVGIITSKKVGKAHDRNLARRRLRALVYENFALLKPGYDLVLIARASLKEEPYEKVVRDYLFLLQKGNLKHA